MSEEKERYKLAGYVEGETVDKIKELQERYKNLFGSRATQGMIIDFLVKNSDKSFEQYEEVRRKGDK